jgi:immune inhibitor A
MPVRALLSAILLVPLAAAFGADPEQAPKPRLVEASQTKAADADLAGYKTVATAIKADPKTFKALTLGKPVTAGFVGIQLAAAKGGAGVVIDAVAPGSPAEKAGVKVGDVLAKIGSDEVAALAAAKDRLRGLAASEAVTLTLKRDGKATEVAVTPKPLSQPMTAPGGGGTGGSPRALLGLQAGDPKKDGGVEVTSVTEGGAAEKAGVKAGDVLVSIDDKKIDADVGVRDLLASKRPGEVVKLALKRGEKDLDVRATLTGDEGGGRPGGGRPGAGGGGAAGWDDRLPGAWRRPTYKLAIIGVEYPDVKHNPKISDADWEASMFSVGKYTDKSATGQKVHGSMADYYKEISYGNLKVEGKFVGWVEVSKKRAEYSTGNGVSVREKTALLSEAMDALVKKDKDALKDCDGVFFLYAGGRVQTTRGGLYWPHRSSVTHAGKRWPYFIVQEGGTSMTDISVFCHEFGHMLGLPDLYARPEVPGMEGVGVWCAMSQQLPNGRPQHFSAWSKEQLGWLKPTMVDPRVKQKLILSPIEDDATQCYKVPLKADGSEYLLLENRQKRGWDTGLPAEGLLVWRVIPGNGTQKVFLEEAHGIEGPTGPRSASGAVPFPSPANDSFTPYTTPSSKATTGGGFDVFVTNVRRLPDGRITFHLGYEYQ